jgi:hypothetical protein
MLAVVPSLLDFGRTGKEKGGGLARLFMRERLWMVAV